MINLGFPGGSDVKESTCNAGDPASIPRSGISPGEGNGYPLQYSCLKNSMDRGAWWATVQGVAESWTRLRQLSTHAVENSVEISQKTENRTVTGGKGAGPNF